ncbi:hypothetical protein [Pseudomonas typographi]|uniref:hypothetical protein n=1 Tax=Pseudomonas typographi TaxID=2715964 RepID=UPI001EEE4C93|nr:hypothetical protein [Pseudomonas typographi]
MSQNDHAAREGGPSVPPPEPLRHVAEEAASALDEAKEQGAEQYERYRDVAAQHIDSLVEGAKQAAGALQGNDSLGLSQYLTQWATGLGTFADQVREQSAEDLLHKGAQLARDNPALFVGASVAVGFGLSRFLRASGTQPAPAAAEAPTFSAAPADEPAVPALASAPAETAGAAPPALGATPDPLGEAASYPGSASPYDEKGNFKGDLT